MSATMGEVKERVRVDMVKNKLKVNQTGRQRDR